MVTMYFLYIYTFSNSTQMIPHILPLFSDKVQCEEVRKEIVEIAPSGRSACLPIKVEKK